MMTFFNKYKRFLYFVSLCSTFILMFFPFVPGNVSVNRAGTILFFYSYKLDVTPAIIAHLALAVAFLMIFIRLILLLTKKRIYSISQPYIFLLIPTFIKIDSLSNYYMSRIIPDYIIIFLTVLMVIIDIVRLRLYIRTHQEEIQSRKDAIHTKAADITASLKTKLHREHKPTKDERIAELEERVKQLEDKQDE